MNIIGKNVRLQILQATLDAVEAKFAPYADKYNLVHLIDKRLECLEIYAYVTHNVLAIKAKIYFDESGNLVSRAMTCDTLYLETGLELTTFLSNIDICHYHILNNGRIYYDEHNKSKDFCKVSDKSNIFEAQCGIRYFRYYDAIILNQSPEYYDIGSDVIFITNDNGYVDAHSCTIQNIENYDWHSSGKFMLSDVDNQFAIYMCNIVYDAAPAEYNAILIPATNVAYNKGFIDGKNVVKRNIIQYLDSMKENK